MKQIEKNYNNIKNALLGVLVLLVYFILPNFQTIPFSMFGINFNKLNNNIQITYSIIFYILLMCIIVFILKDKLKNDFKIIKKNHKKYFGDCFKYWLIALIVMMISNLILNTLVGGIADNEKQIRELFNINPIYIFFSAVIFAPVVEELTFRQSLRNLFKTDILFILFSGLLFGLLHVINYSNISEFLYIIPYSAPGIAFAYMLTKYDNIFVSMGFHFMHNGILIALQFIILLFG